MARAGSTSSTPMWTKRPARKRAGSTRWSSRRACPPTTGGWCTLMTGRCSSPTPRTPPNIWTSTWSHVPDNSHFGRTALDSALGGITVYERNGEKYFVVDSHTHFWDASPANWVLGQEQYAKGWIECFHAYQGLGPPETHWPIEQFQKYSEDRMMKDLFDDGHVDIAIFQPTNLRQWYKNGFNTTEVDGAMAERHPGKFVVNS